MPAKTIDDAQNNPLQGLRPVHPRLFVNGDEDFDRIRELVQTDDVAKRWYERLLNQGEKMLEQPVSKHELRDGIRMLGVSRDTQNRAFTLGLLHRINPDPRYVERVWADMEAVSSFPDWNPSHFLDVGEMALAAGIAYDWFYDDWTDGQRKTIREGLVRNGLKPALRAYEEGAWWTKTDINWNQVCNGGLIAGALAIADEEPEVASQMISKAVPALTISMARYVPEGGYEEGPGYWNYGTSFNVYALAVLDSALGHDFGLGDTPGFERTGAFPILMTGPTGRAFNFADANESTVRSPALLYLAQRYHQPAYARFALQYNSGSPLDLLWYEPALLQMDTESMPLAERYETVGVVMMRSANDDPNALFVAVKAGHNGKAHGQLDLGSFVLEAQNVRWIVDLGRDDYNLPGYFSGNENGQRWTYYRNRAEGHNTLVINPTDKMDQPLKAHAPVTLDGFTTMIDLSSAYPRPVTRVIELDPDKQTVRVKDTILEYGDGKPMDLWWFAHTRATVELSDNGRTATLSQDGKQLRVELVQPADAKFTVMDASPLPTSPDAPGQNPNNGASKQNASGHGFVHKGDIPTWANPDPSKAFRKLAIHLDGFKGGEIEVVFAQTP